MPARPRVRSLGVLARARFRVGRCALAVLLVGLVAACVPPSTTAPAPDQGPSAEAIRDSLERMREIARADSLARLEQARIDSIARLRGMRLRICGGGDVLLGTNIDTSWAGRTRRWLRRPFAVIPDADSLLFPLRPLVADADIILLNIEGAIGEGEAPVKCPPGASSCYAFRQPPAAAAALRRLGGERVVVGNLANNHARDAGESGLALTADHLTTADVRITGVDTLPTVVSLPGGERVAILGFSTSGGPDPRDLAAVERHVRRAVSIVPRVVVTMHMGAEGVAAQRTPDSTEIFLGRVDRGNAVAFARTAVDAGAGLVVGHGPHVMRAMEWRGDALIMYSLGNLVTYGPFSLAEPLNRGAIACVLLDGTGAVVEADLRPTMQLPPGLVQADRRRRAAVLVDSLSRIDFPDSRAEVDPQGRIVRPGVVRR